MDEIDDDMLALWLLVAEGLELSRIAERLYVSERTAKRMVADLRNRLGATTRIQMAALAGRAGLLDDWPKASQNGGPSTNGTKPAALATGDSTGAGVHVSMDRTPVANESRGF